MTKVYQSSKNLWVNGKSLIISGKVDTKDETPTILVNDISTGENFGEGRVFIKIPKNARAEDLAKLKEIFLANSGNQAVTLIFEKNPRKRVNLPIKINWTRNLASQISAILDKDVNLD